MKPGTGDASSADAASTGAVEAAVADLCSRLSIQRSNLDVLRADWGVIVLAVDRRSRVYVYELDAEDRPVLKPSEAGDGGYDFAPPPGFDT